MSLASTAAVVVGQPREKGGSGVAETTRTRDHQPPKALAMSKTIVVSLGDALPSLESGHRPVDPAAVGCPLDQEPLAVRTAGITSVR